CPDGHGATGKLISDVNGNLYGVTYDGGVGQGLVFELAHDPARTTWSFNVLYTFCVDHGFCLDGNAPFWTGLTYAGAETGAPYDGVSPLFGSTSEGGRGGDATDAGSGTLFEMTPGKHGGWTHKIIYSFCVNTTRPRCKDGGPSNGLTIDADGALYGPTSGGKNQTGVIFRIAPDGDKWNQNFVHVFGPFSGGDGDQPNGGVALAPSGAVVGTTAYGGGNDIDYYKIGGGTLFSAGSAYAILHSFCAEPACADGEYPGAPVVFDAADNIFGTTSIGGTTYNDVGAGVVFRMGADGKYKVLHAFCSSANCADGAFPDDGVVIAPSGKLYGTTSAGGAHPTDGFAAGTVFEITP
ncbi:MAG TPA: choice-of-anchor tandem repeat GloVer-containing protein, partial [Rhizomicrobium sp.]|nr:choice-of-anchor tandem repeat GloVer-containing protein [Rhizomicrobium sp.]